MMCHGYESSLRGCHSLACMIGMGLDLLFAVLWPCSLINVVLSSRLHFLQHARNEMRFPFVERIGGTSITLIWFGLFHMPIWPGY